MVTAAVLKGVGEDVQVHDDIEIAPPGPGECKVKIVASGVCHSDLSVLYAAKTARLRLTRFSRTVNCATPMAARMLLSR
jgi:Zn-dependent alcohol dehydrogenase